MDQSSTLEKVKQWAGPGATVSSYGDVSVPGMELFSVIPAPPAGVVTHDETPSRRGVAAQRGGAVLLEGKAAMQAALDAGACSSPDAIAPLAALLEADPVEQVRVGAARGLGAIGGERAAAALRAAQPGATGEVRRAIAFALAQIERGQR